MDYYRQTQLKNYNSFKTEALAKLFCRPKNVEEFRKCLSDYPNEQKLIIGGGCNLFFTKDFDGLVICPEIKGLREISDEEEEDEDVFLEVSASENWDEFVAYCVERGFAGLENLSLIPGTVGAAPIQNIGAYGAEVKDVIREVVAIDMETGEAVSFNNNECEFGYRDSVFKRTGKYFVISVVFHLKRTFVYTPKYFDLNKELEDIAEPTIQDVREAVIRVRQRKLPDEKVLPNAGSFFKNPYITKELASKIQTEYPDIPAYPQKDGLIKTSAAFLIDKAGYKAKRVGEIGTYPYQPLIIVNYGSSDGNDILRFMNEVCGAVKDTFSIELEPEVRIY
ncbi:UDP-N-acetylmuramate dehydrogenase [Dysgonomonas sp. PFB1-18]|uniref:UDP-N-acetylmuramate dehydrogenase n=1 Tax=unclassified Dysgonomonas TaxID=2630389 RepID=UPI00247610F0|nr:MULTISPECIES: UDP-N-acetylmuramate dehydrogenase [unclassified Dysgonomonas]MDH6307814.1 UDP-N-acetylmuramate dehydrogenase [Dysgonomonas sp. PF1-14]MDH6337732.1 UDP-N-acetylmuramate dehydrogenase [Dysgonomonas sp. PF1-16]MDH6378956.1 UDP-N-acetylmuramate dehydrogenase [Dysgonomonas sp. PFB1-18]MDH6396591.1 UDP-N-acetylmuramate dehydrogenase [Dysgonomonas sp. PF1-23]